MSRIIAMNTSDRVLSARARAVPVVSTMAASLITLLPFIATAPLVPPLGLLVFLAWRLLRPEFWPLWAGLPLGLWDDLFSGAPLGSAMLAWTLALFAIDAFDRWLVWRDYWQDWAVAALVIAGAIMFGFVVALATGGGGSPRIMAPQVGASILAFPAVVRVCALLDRWRLLR